MQEERRIVSTMQETFVKKIADLSAVVAELNVNMGIHRTMMEEIKESQKEYKNFAILMERNSNKVDEAMRHVKEVHDMHSKCNIKDLEKDFIAVKAKLQLIGGAIFVIASGSGIALFKIFMP